MTNGKPATKTVEFSKVTSHDGFPKWAARPDVEEFLHEKMKPYQDPPHDVHAALDYCFRPDKDKGGFVMLAKVEGKLTGVCVMLKTGMKGYIPEWLLLMIAVDPELRGHGIGGKLAKACLADAGSSVKLHVEYGNPAKHLYERLGFTTKYAEMRYYPENT